MKKNILYLCLVALVFTAVGCDSKKTPEAVAEEFLAAVDGKDFEKAKSLSTTGSHQILDLLAGFAAQLPPVTEPKKVSACQVEGEKATCTYCCEQGSAESTLTLKQVEGEWKADMSKESMGGDPMQGLDDEAPALEEDIIFEEGTDSTVLDTATGM